jgi:hypothetical protein
MTNESLGYKLPICEICLILGYVSLVITKKPWETIPWESYLVFDVFKIYRIYYNVIENQSVIFRWMSWLFISNIGLKRVEQNITRRLTSWNLGVKFS